VDQSSIALKWSIQVYAPYGMHTDVKINLKIQNAQMAKSLIIIHAIYLFHMVTILNFFATNM
jgi:hypothetical protein